MSRVDPAVTPAAQPGGIVSIAAAESGGPVPVTAADPPEQATPAAEAAPAGDGRLKPALKWSYVITTGGYTVTALVGFVLAAILEPRQFGVMAIAMVFVSLAQMLMQHGPTIAVIQQGNITGDHINAAFWSTMGGAFLFAAVLAASTPLWSALNDLPELTPVLLALTLIVPLQASTVIPDAVNRRRMNMRGIALRAIAGGVSGGLVGVGCALAGLGVWALVAQQLSGVVVYVVAVWAASPVRPRLRGPLRKPLRDMRGMSLSTMADAVGFFAQARSDVLLMGAFFGPVVVGLYRFAARFAELAVDVTARGLQQVSLPHLSQHSSDPQELAAKLGRIVHAGAVLSFPALGIVAAVADPLVLIIGSQWADAAAPLRLLCLVSAIGIVSSLLQPGLQAAARPGIPAAFTWISALFSGVAIFVSARLSASGGTSRQLLAVAAAVLIVQALHLVALGYVTFRRVFHVSVLPTVRAMGPATLSGVAAAVTGFLVDAALPSGAFLLVRLVACGVPAAAIACGLLLAMDPEVRSQSASVVARLRRLLPRAG